MVPGRERKPRMVRKKETAILRPGKPPRQASHGKSVCPPLVSILSTGTQDKAGRVPLGAAISFAGPRPSRPTWPSFFMSDSHVLKNLKPSKEFFIGIDSDGCVFDTMELKHKECFAPVFIKQFRLQTVNKYAREVWDFVNLYSKTRGANRFEALARALRLLRERKEVVARGAALPDPAELEAWIARAPQLSNSGLKKEIDAGHPGLAPALAWSLGVNKAVEENVSGVPPLPFVRESLQKMVQSADVIVVSQSATETLVREWKEHDIDQFVRILAGQEL